MKIDHRYYEEGLYKLLNTGDYNKLWLLENEDNELAQEMN